MVGLFTRRPGAPVLRHGATYAGHPACAAAAIAALNIYEQEGLIERGRTLEEPLLAALTPLASDPRVTAVRGGTGLMAAVELREEVLHATPDAVGRWQRACRRQGVLVRALGRGLAVSPPLVVTEQQIEEVGQAMLDGLASLPSS